MSSGEPAGRPGPRWGSATDAERPPVEAGIRNAFERVRDGMRPEAPEQPLATVMRRAGGWLIDLLIKLLLLELVFAVGGVNATSPLALELIVPVRLLSHGYDWLFWMNGWTPGSRLLGMRIVRLDGTAPGAGVAFLRVATSVVSDLVLFLGYFWAIWDPRRQTWHDKAAGTFVVMSDVDPPRAIRAGRR